MTPKVTTAVGLDSTWPWLLIWVAKWFSLPNIAFTLWRLPRIANLHIEIISDILKYSDILQQYFFPPKNTSCWNFFFSPRNIFHETFLGPDGEGRKNRGRDRNQVSTVLFRINLYIWRFVYAISKTFSSGYLRGQDWGCSTHRSLLTCSRDGSLPGMQLWTLFQLQLLNFLFPVDLTAGTWAKSGTALCELPALECQQTRIGRVCSVLSFCWHGICKP